MTVIPVTALKVILNGCVPLVDTAGLETVDSVTFVPVVTDEAASAIRLVAYPVLGLVRVVLK
jgi:hypothetical protein